MLQRYMAAHNFLYQLSISRVEYLLPTRGERKSIDKLFPTLRELEIIKKTLQFDSQRISQLCPLFDTVIKHYPGTENFLKANAKIMKSPDFEIALVKI